MDFSIIAAIAENGVIGNNGEIPWDIPEDQQHFKELTMGSPVIMGRRTYDSIVDKLGGPLPDRINIVLTSHPGQIENTHDSADSLDGIGDVTAVHAAGFLDEAAAFARSTGGEETFVAGGESIYIQFMDVADRMYITEIHDEYEGDTKFPQISSDWQEVARDKRDGFSFVQYDRVAGKLGDI